MQTSPKEIQRTLEHAEASFSRARMLRMIHRLRRQYEARERKVRFNERVEALQIAKHNHAHAQMLGIYRARLVEAQSALTPTPAGDTA